MKKEYIYIDDDSLQKSQDKVEGFQSEFINILAQQHKGNWELQLSYIQDISQKIDGLILDLGLCDLPNEHDEHANFRGTSLAQEIRTRQKEGIIKSFPIILFSGNDKLSLLLETTGLDLFDLCIDKESVNVDIFDELSSKLYALANGYSIIDNNIEHDIEKILCTSIDHIDSRLIVELNSIIKNPNHVIANFVINELLNRQGLLVDEQTLASRFGVDIKKSEDWKLLLGHLQFAKYKGIFSEGWERWWMQPIEDWWHNDISDNSLRTMGATQRVEKIKEKLDLTKLITVNRINGAESDAFWTICQGYNKPIDTIDGLLIAGQENLYPWQEPKFVSIDAAVKRVNIENWKEVSGVEKNFLEELRRNYK